MRKTGKWANGYVGSPPASLPTVPSREQVSPSVRRHSHGLSGRVGGGAARRDRAEWGSGGLSGIENQGVCQPPREWAAVLLRMCDRFPRDGPVTAVTVPLMTGAVAGHTPCVTSAGFSVLGARVGSGYGRRVPLGVPLNPGGCRAGWVPVSLCRE